MNFLQSSGKRRDIKHFLKTSSPFLFLLLLCTLGFISACAALCFTAYVADAIFHYLGDAREAVVVLPSLVFQIGNGTGLM